MPPQVSDPQDPAGVPVGSTDSRPIDSTSDPCVDVTPTQEVPQATPVESQQQACEVDALVVNTDPPGEESVKAEPEPMITDRLKDASVEVLQERLRLVEQRFTGKVVYIVHLCYYERCVY